LFDSKMPAFMMADVSTEELFTSEREII